MPGFLDGMARGSRARLAQAIAREPLAALRRRCLDVPRAPALRPAGPFDVIAEFKLSSPSQGALAAPGHDVAAQVRTYAQAGAAAVSVLTEPQRFAGSLAHLEAAAAALAPLGVPAMRKDFLVDPYQLYEARAAGAGGALLIVRMLTRPQLGDMLGCAQALGLFVLLEAFDEADIEVAHEVLEHDAPCLVGVNSRDLQTLEVVPDRLLELAPRLPRDCLRVAESGVATAADAARVASAGYDLALVGSALMRAPEPGALLAAMIAAGRDARS